MKDRSYQQINRTQHHVQGATVHTVQNCVLAKGKLKKKLKKQKYIIGNWYH